MSDAPSTTTNLIRSNLREYRKLERLKDRNESSDAFRIGVGAIKEIIEDFDNISEKDVTGLASRIKRRKGATEEDLNRLGHAFLLNVENIVTFSKITGALNVVVKELTGNDSAKRVLACECLCNFSLGNDVCCEKLTSVAGSYLILFLENTHQRLAITSAWTILNILVSDQTKSVDILLAQGLVPKLINLLKLKSSHNELIEESNKCLYILLSKHRNCLRSQDVVVLKSYISDFMSNRQYSIEVTYHALFLFDFEVTQDECTKILGKCVEFLCNFVKSTTHDQKLSVALVLRIIGNFIALPSQANKALNEIIGQLALRDETLAGIISKMLNVDSAFKRELLWIAGNIYQTNANFREEIVNALAFLNLEIN